MPSLMVAVVGVVGGRIAKGEEEERADPKALIWRQGTNFDASDSHGSTFPRVQDNHAPASLRLFVHGQIAQRFEDLDAAHILDKRRRMKNKGNK